MVKQESNLFEIEIKDNHFVFDKTTFKYFELEFLKIN